MQQVLTFATVLMPIVTALVELIKVNINMPKNIIPFISLVIGMIIGIIASPFTDLGIILRIWAGGF
ncbi:MAG TPA: holin, partial [Clostridiales bacterium]|nr:holin [Clostridiales bacterium]